MSVEQLVEPFLGRVAGADDVVIRPNQLHGVLDGAVRDLGLLQLGTARASEPATVVRAMMHSWLW